MTWYISYVDGQKNQTDQVIETLKAVQSQFPKIGKEDGLLIMAHGTQITDSTIL